MDFRELFYARWDGMSIPNPDIAQVAEYAGGMAGKMFHRQFVSEERDNPVLRLSGLGKYSIVEVLAKKFGLLKQGGDHTVDNQCRLRFLAGDLFECTFYVMLHQLGFTVNETQKSISWHGVDGHTDFIVTTPEGEQVLLELKTANDYYFKQIKKWIGDERGYLTQLITYQECVGLPAYWVFYNKDTSEIFIKALEDVPEEQREQRHKRALGLVKAFNECESWEDFPLFCQVPPPKIEKLKDGTHKTWSDTGLLKLYIGDYDYVKPELFYVVDRKKNDYGKLRNYVTDFVYPEKHANLKPDIYESALHFDH